MAAKLNTAQLFTFRFVSQNIRRTFTKRRRLFPVHTDVSFWTRSGTVWRRSATFCYVYVCDFPSGNRALLECHRYYLWNDSLELVKVSTCYPLPIIRNRRWKVLHFFAHPVIIISLVRTHMVGAPNQTKITTAPTEGYFTAAKGLPCRLVVELGSFAYCLYRTSGATDWSRKSLPCKLQIGRYIIPAGRY